MPGMKNSLKLATLTLLLLVLSWPAPSRAQTAQSAQTAQAQTEGAQQFADLGDLHLRNGSVIHDFRLGYRTFGKLNAEKSNAVLWPTWLGGKSQDLVQFIGPDKVVDSTRYCSISPVMVT